jgi:hypothetical protein
MTPTLNPEIDSLFEHCVERSIKACLRHVRRLIRHLEDDGFLCDATLLDEIRGLPATADSDLANLARETTFEDEDFAQDLREKVIAKNLVMTVWRLATPGGEFDKGRFSALISFQMWRWTRNWFRSLLRHRREEATDPELLAEFDAVMLPDFPFAAGASEDSEGKLVDALLLGEVRRNFDIPPLLYNADWAYWHATVTKWWQAGKPTTRLGHNPWGDGGVTARR